MLRLTKVTMRLRFGSLMFAVSCIASAAAGILMGIIISQGDQDELSAAPFTAAGICLIFSVCFSVGTEFSNGTVRNKLIQGYTKTQFYLVQLVTALTEALILCLCAGVPYILIGWNRFFSLFDTELLVKSLVLMAAGVLLSTAIIVFLCISVRNTAYALIVCAGALFLLFTVSNSLDSALTHPEYSKESGGEIEYDPETETETEITWEKVVPGKYYVKEPRRTVYTILWKIDPITCLRAAQDMVSCRDWREQHFTVEQNKALLDKDRAGEGKYLWDIDHLEDRLFGSIYYPIWSGLTVLVLTGIGILIFRKRNIS
ncbi:MAG: hypothetical protein IKO27_05710 [Ruminococcus sp.]|nr:hypothetical protein [Ruminococcus sp.]